MLLERIQGLGDGWAVVTIVSRKVYVRALYVRDDRNALARAVGAVGALVVVGAVTRAPLLRPDHRADHSVVI